MRSFKLSPFLTSKQKPWWIEIRTSIPQCTYFFGPFKSHKKAKQEQSGYIEDLIQEKAFGITVEIKQCRPTSLTVFNDT